MKKILIFFSFVILLFGVSINEDLLFIEAKLYPKIIMLTKNFSKKKQIKILVLYNKDTREIAKKYVTYFPKNSKFSINLSNKIDFKHDVYFFTYIPELKIVNKLVKKNKIIFTLLPNTVKHVMFGIYIGVRVFPYINPKLLREANIKIDPIIFKVGKIYDK